MTLSISKAPVVPIWAATVLPARSASFSTPETAFFTTRIWPALMYGTEKSMVCLRSSVMVTDDMTASYLPPSRPAKMPSQAVFLNSTSKPPALAAAFIRSMSKPTMFLLSSTISMGGQVASVAMTIFDVFFAQAAKPKSTATSSSAVRILLNMHAPP